MCQARTSKGENKIKALPAIVTKTPENIVAIQAKQRLNPAATEFISSRSESEVSSVGDEAETEQPGHLNCEEVSFASQKNKGRKGSEGQMDQSSEDIEEHERFHGYQNYGWESPQVRLLKNYNPQLFDLNVGCLGSECNYFRCIYAIRSP